ncbi:hypothetical protein [Amycolatopsis benzoatilytica]|uniref:hypothetical protein n=1 Tax=Amycolatopsis benzoatilytica TaxID=346045 RepID=UPI000372DC54|nr:hypothetical protein [Amycolatopsis benzoatilytica]
MSYRPALDASLTRRRLLQISAATGASLLGAAACSSSASDQPAPEAPPPDGALGANFNDDAEILTWDDLDRSHATWVRGFTAMPKLDRGPATADPTVKKLLAAAERRHRTVLTLKFPYFHQPLPRPGTPEMQADLARVDKILPAVLDKVDILTIGNEPFIESTRADWNNGALNAFYETIAAHVLKSPAGKTVLYMGALNNLDDPKWTGKGTERWLQYVRETSGIAGTDLHPHVGAQGEVQAFLDYTLPRLGAKKFLATEFSLVQLWKKHLSDPVPAAYASKYRVPADTKVWQVIRDSLHQPVPKQQWYDFLSGSPWFEDNKHFLRDQMARFRGTGKLAVACYGIDQGTSSLAGGNFGPQTPPWLLNSVFARATVQRNPDGTAAPNYAWLEDFTALQ